LIVSLDETVDEDAEAAWQATIERRIAEIDSGAVKMVPWSEARKEDSRELMQKLCTVV